MRTLSITVPYVARINAVAILDAQRGTVGLVRVCARLAERLDLDPAEQAAIGFVRIPAPNGAGEVPAWNAAATLEARTFELSPDEARHLKRAIEDCELLRRKDLTWAEPLLAQLEV